MATPMDIETLGSPREGNSRCFKPPILLEVTGFHKGGTTWRNLIPSHFNTLIRRSWVQTPVSAKSSSAQELIARIFKTDSLSNCDLSAKNDGLLIKRSLFSNPRVFSSIFIRSPV